MLDRNVTLLEDEDEDFECGTDANVEEDVRLFDWVLVDGEEDEAKSLHPLRQPSETLQ